MKKPVLLNVITNYILIIIRKIISILPDFISIYLGTLGYTMIIKQSPKVNFKAKLYGGPYKINVKGEYFVERHATRKKIAPFDPYIGLRKLNLNNKIALDIGANIGSISIGLAALGCKKIYSIEPGPMFKRLIENININSLNEIVVPTKIGFNIEPGELFWAEDKNNPGNAHLVNNASDIDFKKIPTKFDSAQFIRVPVTTLDKFFNEKMEGKIDLIKIDVEGMEWSVLSGGKNTISKFLPIVVAETHRVASDMMKYDCMTPMFQFFYNLDYRSFCLDSKGHLVEFIYPNFSIDTFFIHENDVKLIKN